MGLLRVGGRLDKAQIPLDARHSIMIAQAQRLTHLIVLDIHVKIARTLIRPPAPIMAGLPLARVTLGLPVFTNCGVDYFRPFEDLELSNILQRLDQPKITRRLPLRRVVWKFVLLSCPHVGGAGEALLRSVKRSLKNTDAVIIMEPDTFHGKWTLEKIQEVFPGNDGVVPPAPVRANGTTIHWLAAKLCLLESADEDVDGLSV
ncbi:hypothetical protein TTRE_0000691001 [Trichuris trichiura]|uniref:DUF5641 domain-containing protein n=1 Tax=Trichuris trichiura TaxID=36087 RepID=A0A077ZDY6_TRITR|nr:hypothetical protein TTRE_0000691001 [Trichuris trichiura]